MAYTVEKAYQLIEAAHKRNRLAHAFLITGEAGCGKADLAAKVISLVNPPEKESGGGINLFGEAEPVEQQSLDELEGVFVRIVKPQSKSRRIKVDAMRELERFFHLASAEGKWKVGVIMHADRMNESSENAFLKTLEEPPNNSLLLLLTDAPDLLLPTILSRCVRLPLLTAGGELITSASQNELLVHLASMSKQGLGNIAIALTLRSAFSGILAKRRMEITKVNEAALKEETKRYKNTTDGVWLKQRDDFYKAHTESEYLNEREKLLHVLIAWMGDVVRQKSGAARLDFPKEKEATARVASNHELSELLQRMDAMEDLRANLETNMQEQLVLEVAFLTAFG